MKKAILRHASTCMALGLGLSTWLCAPGAAAEPNAQAVVVDIDVQSGPADLALVRTAIEKELAAPTITVENAAKVKVRGTLKVRLERVKKTLTVSWTDERGASVSRTIASTGDSETVASSSALLAGNLVRDQTSDLVSALRPADPAAEPTPPPEKPATPPNVGEQTFFPANLAFFYPVATNWGKPDLRTNLDVGILYTRVGEVGGVQASAFVGRIDGKLQGVQAAGFLSVASEVHGVQSAGGASITSGTMRGAQLAAGASVAGDVIGAQAATVNVAKDVTGLQFGVVNVGHRVRGAQIGVVNVSDDVDGAAIGVVNVSKTGSISATTWTSTSAYANLGVRFATKYFYTIASAAFHQDDGNYFGYGFAFGAQIPVVGSLYADIDAAASELWKAPEILHTQRRHFFRPRLMARYAFTPNFAAYGGVGLGVRFEDDLAVGPTTQGEALVGLQLTP